MRVVTNFVSIIRQSVYTVNVPLPPAFTHEIFFKFFNILRLNPHLGPKNTVQIPLHVTKIEGQMPHPRESLSVRICDYGGNLMKNK